MWNFQTIILSGHSTICNYNNNNDITYSILKSILKYVTSIQHYPLFIFFSSLLYYLRLSSLRSVFIPFALGLQCVGIRFYYYFRCARSIYLTSGWCFVFAAIVTIFFAAVYCVCASSQDIVSKVE